MQLPPKAEKGKSVIKAWHALEKWAMRTRLRPGMNTRLTETSDGTIVTFAPRVQRFVGAFMVSMANDAAVRVGFGTIEGIEPKINGAPITDPDAVLPLGKNMFDASGRSWIGLLIKHDEGEINADDPKAVAVVQCADFRPVLETGTHFHPLAVIKKNTMKDGQEVRRLYQVEYFHLRASWSPAGNKLLISPLP